MVLVVVNGVRVLMNIICSVQWNTSHKVSVGFLLN